jgi:hypothetical protein
MKQTIILTSLLILSFFLSSAQELDFAFKIGASGTETATSVVVHPTDGSVYVCGHFTGTVNFGRFTGWQHRTSNGSKDIFVAKYSADDRLMWVRTVGGSGEDKANDLAVDDAGNVYVTGSFRSTVDFDPNFYARDYHIAKGNTDIFLMKLSSGGHYRWTVATGGTATTFEAGYGVAVDHDNNIYMTGAYEGSAVNFNPRGYTRYLYAPGDLNIFLSKYDPNGMNLWAKSFGDYSLDDMGGRSIAVDSYNNVYFAGSFAGTCRFDFYSSYASLTSAGYQDGFVSSFTKTGGFRWAKRIGGTYSDYVYDVTVDVHNNVGIGGRARGAVSYVSGGFTTFNNTQDAFFARLTSTGSFQWAKHIASEGDWDDVYSVVMDGCGRMYVGGRFCKEGDFDPSTGTYNLYAPECGAWYQNYAYFVACYGADGSYQWAKTSGTNSAPGTGTSQILGMALNACESLYTVGDFSSSQNFDISGGTHTLTPAGGIDAFVSKHFLPEITVTNTNDSGKGSLRNAITCANDHVGPDKIVFNLPGYGPHTIYPNSELPMVRDDHTDVDVSTQSGFYLGQVIIDGSLLGPYSYGMRFDRNESCSLTGLSIKNFSEDGIHGYYTDHLSIKNCQIGASGRDGMQINYSYMPVIQGNIIGLDESASVPEPNSGCGINLFRSHRAHVGGNSHALANTISSNAKDGIFIASDSAGVEGNYIGTNRWGYAAFGNMRSGIQVVGKFNRIGGISGYGNLIAYNGLWGIMIQNNPSYTRNHFWLNSYYCNNHAAIEINTANAAILPPVITTATTTEISGTTDPGTFLVDIYAADNSGCSGATCQGRYYLGFASVDASGNWKLTGSFSSGISVVAMRTDGNKNSSEFSTCHTTTGEDPNNNQNNRQAGSDVAVEGITLFPNPTTEYFSIKTDVKVEGVKIIDLKGRVLKQTGTIEAGQRISVGDLTAGFYIAQVKTEAGEKAIRFVVKR